MNYTEFVDVIRTLAPYKVREIGGGAVRADFLSAGCRPREDEELREIAGKIAAENGDGEGVLAGDCLVLRETVGARLIWTSLDLRKLWTMEKSAGWNSMCRYLDNKIGALRQVLCAEEDPLLQDYGRVKDRLVIRLASARAAEEGGGKTAFRSVCDVAQMLCLREPESPEFGCVPVPAALAAKWGMPENQVYWQALMNTMRFFPPKLRAAIGSGRFMTGPLWGSDCPVSRILPGSGIELTAEKTNCGAAAIFYPGACRRLSELAGGSFYMTFLHPDACRIYPAEVNPVTLIADLTRESLQTSRGQEILSEKLYYYDALRETLELWRTG